MRAPGPVNIAGVFALIVAGAFFGAIAASITDGAPLVLLDERIAAWLHGQITPARTAISIWVSRLHTHLAVFLLATFFAGLLASRGQWRWATAVVAVIPGGLIFNALLKQVFQRARPVFDDPILTVASYSFPSGHTAAATLLYGLLAAYLGRRATTWPARARIAAYAAFMVMLVGLSRMYLGVHYLSDVLAAVSASTAWLVLCLTVIHARPPRHH